jgi:hypothetical protein
MNLLILTLIYIILNNNKNLRKIKNNYVNIDQVFKYADENKNGKLSVKEMLNNFDLNGRTVSTKIFIATILDYQIRNKNKILINNELSLKNFRKLSVSDLKLDLFDEKKKDKNGNLKPLNDYAKNLLNESNKIISNNI